MSKHGEVLVAIIYDLKGFADLRDRHWYRIPISSANKWLKDCFPPVWISFYQTKKFGSEAFAINYVAKVEEIRQVYRYEIFPDEPINEKTNRQYYQIFVSPLQLLPKPIFSYRRRRIFFIPTTLDKFKKAEQINY
jgi:hypothetical protein